jgi:hypothetical protein
VLLLCVALGNSSFIGYPMVQALLGEHALPYAVVYDQFGIFVLLSTFGLYVLARYGGDAPPTLRTVAVRMLRFPPLWALLLGLTLMPATPPAWIAGGLQRLADALLPLVMLAVGLTIQLRLPRDEVKPLAVGLALRLLVLPALALPLSLAFGLRDDMLRANVLESATRPLPPSSNSARSDPEQGHALALLQAAHVLELAEHDRHRGRADVAVFGEDGEHLACGSMPSLDQGLGVHLADLVDDELVESSPTQPSAMLGGDEGLAGQLEAFDQQHAGVGDHAVEVAAAQARVPLGGGATRRRGSAAVRGTVRRAQHHRGGARAQGQRGQFVAELLGGDVGALRRSMVFS